MKNANDNCKRIYIINRITELSVVTTCHEPHILVARWRNDSYEWAIASVRPFGAIKKNCHFSYFIIIFVKKRDSRVARNECARSPLSRSRANCGEAIPFSFHNHRTSPLTGHNRCIDPTQPARPPTLLVQRRIW